MKKNIFAVCDLEVDYAHNFMDYLNQKRNIPFEIQAFTSVEQLLRYGRDQHIEILLISDKAMCPQVKELNAGKIMILSEGVHPPELDQYPSVYKYQSSDHVIREVMACYGADKAVPSPMAVPKKPMEILGVYSPLGRTLKTSFALTLGQILSRDKVVLYLNMEEYSGFEELFQVKYEHNLSDVLYYVRQEHVNLAHKISGMIESVNNLDYLPPVHSPGDILTATEEEWNRLIDTIVMHSAYEVLILDFGDGVDGLFPLLDRCSRIFVPVLHDVMSRAKLAQFEELLRVWDYPRILARMEKLKLPYHAGLADGKTYVEQLVWSELGDYVRSLLRKEKE